jgi:hypothetical protein
MPSMLRSIATSCLAREIRMNTETLRKLESSYQVQTNAANNNGNDGHGSKVFLRFISSYHVDLRNIYIISCRSSGFCSKRKHHIM